MRTPVCVACAALALLLTALAQPVLAAELGPLNARGLPVLDARVRYLLAHRNDPAFAGIAQLPLSVRFAAPPDAAALAALERAGAALHRADRVAGARPVHALGAVDAGGRRVLGGRTVFPASVAWSEVTTLAALPGVERVETSWSPQPHQAPLYQTRALIGAEQTWNLRDAQDRAVLGTGVLIADLDSGVDVFHPDYWRDDGASYVWIDVDLNGTLTDGDAVDLNGNHVADANETLRWLDAPGSAPGQAGTENPAIDHVYLDANHNNVRDFGLSFGEAAPTYGEPVYRPRDLDGNGTITLGEPLVALGTSKIEAIYQRDAVVRRRGVDLIQSEPDIYSHGTNVASILLGGEPGRRFAGIAPGASLVMANLGYGADPPFVSPFDVRMAWAAAEGADVMLYEDGEWIWLFLDGSSNVEELVNQYAEAGILQLGAAGNLATGDMHWQGPLGPAVGDSAIATLNVTPGVGVTHGWGQLYWVPREGETVAVEMQAPTGERFPIGGAGSTTHTTQFDVWGAEDESSHGTTRVDFGLALSPAATLLEIGGTWHVIARRTGAPASTPLTLNAMSWDELSGWSGYSTWTQPSVAGTVTWPATADSMIVVAAFEPTGGALNGFSGRGPRVDGRNAIDVTAPGSTTWTGRRYQSSGGVAGGYGAFGGTSAALPHAAGSCALLRQWLPDATHGEIRALLRASAGVDAATGAIPNADWGYGKLNVFRAAQAGVVGVTPATVTRGALALAGGPNPFRAAIELRYRLECASDVTAVVYDLAGRVVRRLGRGREPMGAHAVRWDGRDSAGAPVRSGVYLVRVGAGGVWAARRVVRIE